MYNNAKLNQQRKWCAHVETPNKTVGGISNSPPTTTWKKNHSLLLLWWVYVCTCCDILTTWGLCSATRSHRTSGQKNGKILHYILLLISENHCVNKSTKYLLTVYLLCFIFHINGFESWFWILIYMHILDGLHYTDIKVKENLEIHKQISKCKVAIFKELFFKCWL